MIDLEGTIRVTRVDIFLRSERETTLSPPFLIRRADSSTRARGDLCPSLVYIVPLSHFREISV